MQNNLLITHASLQNTTGLFDLFVKNGVITQITPVAQTPKNYDKQMNILHANGGLLLPPFIDSHIHYDSAYTAGSPRWNKSGTLLEGIKCNNERQASADENDYLTRAKKAIEGQVLNGVQYARVHADVSQDNLSSLKAMLKVKKEMRHLIEIQVVAFPQMGITRSPEQYQLLEAAVKLGADGIGGVPHLEMTREDGVRSIELIFDLAQRYHKFIDIHCDETDDEQSRFVEVVAAQAIRRKMGAQTTASHVTALHSYNNAYAAKVIHLIKQAKMNIVANPLTNIALQGRFDSAPVRRGVTRIKALADAGINVSLGQDNLADAFYPFGTGSMLPALNMAIHACHLLGSEDIDSSINMITDNAAKTLAIAPQQYGIQVGKPANFVVMQATCVYDCIRTQSPVRFNVKNGQLLAENEPLKGKIHADF